MQQNDIQTSKDIMGGTPVFAGTRVPIRTFLDYIEGGSNVDQFLDDFPTVTKEQVVKVLNILKEKIGNAVA